MQVEPMNPTLKVPGAKRLNLKYDELLSSFAFNFNLRRYTAVTPLPNEMAEGARPADTETGEPRFVSPARMLKASTLRGPGRKPGASFIYTPLDASLSLPHQYCTYLIQSRFDAHRAL